MTGPSGRPIEANGFEHLSDAELAGYLDHDITPEERRRVETHIDQCAPCRSELVALSRITHADTAARTVPPRRHRWWIPAAAAATIGALLVPRLTIHEPAPDTPTRTRRIGETDGRSRLAIVSPDGVSAMAEQVFYDPDLEWLDHVSPVGLVIAPNLIKEIGLVPERQTQTDFFLPSARA